MAHQAFRFSANKRRSEDIREPDYQTKRPRTNDYVHSSVRLSISLPSLLVPGRLSVANENTAINLRWQKVTQAIWQFSESHRQSRDTYERKLALRATLYEVIKLLSPGCGLYIVGSSVNGFGGANSDMDMCLMVANQPPSRAQASNMLGMLRKILRRCTFLRDLMVIRAKVPILKFIDTVSGVQCDLNINNSVGIRNTHLLHAYSQLDKRLCALALFVKYWAKTQNINDASMATISSYSLVLMVIHYLQYVCSPPVLPSLQVLYPTDFSLDTDIRCLRLDAHLPPYQSANNQSVGELFVGFLRYYAHQFNYEENAISIRLGKTLPRSAITEDSGLNQQGQKISLMIEEPFERNNTARSVYNRDIFQRILRVFRRSLQEVERTRDIAVILRDPM